MPFGSITLAECGRQGPGSYVVAADGCQRNYTANLSGTRVSLANISEPIGFHLMMADVIDLNIANRMVTCNAGGGPIQLVHDRLVFALGTRLVRPPIPGLQETAAKRTKQTINRQRI